MTYPMSNVRVIPAPTTTPTFWQNLLSESLTDAAMFGPIDLSQKEEHDPATDPADAGVTEH